MLRNLAKGIALMSFLGLVMPAPAMAKFNSIVQDDMFAPEEIQMHRERIATITQTAAACLERTWDDHVAFYNQWGISKYYGNRKPEHKTPEGRAARLAAYGKPAKLLSQLKQISCIGLTTDCLGEGFAAAGMQPTWAKITGILKVDNNWYGTDLQLMLGQLGWTSYYWNPDPSKNKQWDAEDRQLVPLIKDRRWMPVWGGHEERYQSVLKTMNYYGIKIDDATTLVGFKTTVPESFKKAPFFVGTAHSGYHVFPGTHGKVIEAHSMRELNAFDNLEVSDFNPLATKGGPRWTRSEKYRSGVILVPPEPLN